MKELLLPVKFWSNRDQTPSCQKEPPKTDKIRESMFFQQWTSGSEGQWSLRDRDRRETIWVLHSPQFAPLRGRVWGGHSSQSSQDRVPETAELHGEITRDLLRAPFTIQQSMCIWGSSLRLRGNSVIPTSLIRKIGIHEVLSKTLRKVLPC